MIVYAGSKCTSCDYSSNSVRGVRYLGYDFDGYILKLKTRIVF